MAHAAFISEPETSARKIRSWKRFVLVGLILIAIGATILAIWWPFTPERMKKSFTEAIGGQVDFGQFRQTYFPSPGCIIDNMTITQPGGHMLVTRVTVQASYPGLMARRVSRVVMDHPDAYLTSLSAYVGGDPNATHPAIGELVMNEAVLKVGDHDDTQRFVFHRFTVGNLGDGRRMTYKLLVSIPRPAGDLTMDGTLGPYKRSTWDQTALTGNYALQSADLGVFSGLAGKLFSRGKFAGVLQRIDFQGETDTPDFQVKSSTHRHRVKTNFTAVVNAMDGDTQLSQVRASFDATTLTGAGSVTGAPLKTIRFDVGSGKGRIQDLMTLFIKAPQSPMLGPVTFKAKIVIPPGDQPFKNRVVLDGDFGITGGTLSNPATQASADQLSERGEGEPGDTPERVLSNLQGHVVLRNGIANFSNTSFTVPGATINVAGNFNLMQEKIDLHGKLATEATLSKTQTGMKSVFLKLLDPIFKKKHAGAVVPVSITGTYDHPDFRVLMVKQ